MKLGEYQELIYIKKVDFGVYLGETENAQERVLLPAKQVP
ncbi:MAG: RNA-binding protein, partial [Agathobacter sp.]|nr:RNA-binding protein [Agathobacter sp.]